MLARMTAEVVLLIAGCGLVLIGLLGGGIKSTWITIGSVSGIARLLCAMLGILFVVGGVALKLSLFSPMQAKPDAPGSSEKQAQPQGGPPPISPPGLDQAQPGAKVAAPQTRKKPATKDSTEKVSFRVELSVDKLFRGNFTLTTSVYFDGELQRMLYVERAHPDTGEFFTATPGPHHYSLKGVYTDRLTGKVTATSGEGEFTAEQGKELWIHLSRNERDMTLRSIKLGNEE